MNVFLLHTPFQRFIAEHMLVSMDEFFGVRNMAIVDGSGISPNPELWSEVHILEPPLGTRFIGNTQALRQAVARLTPVLDQPGVRLFLSNLDHPLSNGLYGLSQSLSHVTLCSFPEGALNALAGGMSHKKRLKNFAKAAYGRAVRYRFVPLGDDPSGLSQSTQVYSLVPDELDHFQDKVVGIPSVKSKRDSGAHLLGCLVCGQPLTDFMGSTSYLEFTRRLLVFAARHPGPLLFKRHPREPQEIENVARLVGAEVIRRHGVVEEIFEELRPETVVSFCSSVLLHLKVLQGDRVRCIAAGADEVMMKSNHSAEYTHRMKELFTRRGVEWTTLPLLEEENRDVQLSPVRNLRGPS